MHWARPPAGARLVRADGDDVVQPAFRQAVGERGGLAVAGDGDDHHRLQGPGRPPRQGGPGPGAISPGARPLRVGRLLCGVQCRPATSAGTNRRQSPWDHGGAAGRAAPVLVDHSRPQATMRRRPGRNIQPPVRPLALRRVHPRGALWTVRCRLGAGGGPQGQHPGRPRTALGPSLHDGDDLLQARRAVPSGLRDPRVPGRTARNHLNGLPLAAREPAAPPTPGRSVGWRR